MDKAELNKQIADLKEAADKLDETDKAITLNEIDQLKDKMDGGVLDEINNLLQQMSTPDIEDIKIKIEAANDSTTAHQTRVELINGAIGLIKKVLS